MPFSNANRLGGFALTAVCSVWFAAVGCSSSDAGAADTSTTPDTGSGVDAGGDAGGIAYLQECSTVGTPGDCAAGLTCKLFNGKQKNFCTKACTTATAATDCPAPAKGCGGDKFCSPP